MGQNGGSAARSSTASLVGPYLSGKTTLLEAILARTGAVTRQGKIADRTRSAMPHRSPRPRHERRANVADVSFLGRHLRLIAG